MISSTNYGACTKHNDLLGETVLSKELCSVLTLVLHCYVAEDLHIPLILHHSSSKLLEVSTLRTL